MPFGNAAYIPSSQQPSSDPRRRTARRTCGPSSRRPIAGRTITPRRTAPAGRAEAARASAAHLLELGVLLGGQDLREPGVDLFLKVVDLRLLLGAQLQPLLEHPGKDLAGPHRSHHRTAWSATRRAAEAARTASAAVAHRFPRCEGGQLLAGDGPVLVGVGAVEEPLQ